MTKKPSTHTLLYIETDSTIMFCVECGAESELYESLCERCYLRKHTFFSVPDVLDLKLCGNCGARARKKHWDDYDTTEGAIESIVLENILTNKDIIDTKFETYIEFEDDNNAMVNILALGTHSEFKDLEIKEAYKSKVRINRTPCDRCSRIAGNYFESIVQFRADGRHPDEDELDEAQRLVEVTMDRLQKSDRNAFIGRLDVVKGGMDFYVGTINSGRILAKTIANAFGCRFSESSKLIGRKGGRNVYRVTYAVRIPNYRVGDVVLLNDSVLLIKRVQTSKVMVVDLGRGRKYTVDAREFKSIKILGNRTSAQNAVVVSESKKELQLLDPDTYKTVDVIKPKGFTVVGDTLTVIKYDNTIYIVP